MALFFFRLLILTLTKTKDNAMHNLRFWFDKILMIVKKFLKNFMNKNGNLLKNGSKPKFSDAKFISLSLLAENPMHYSENYLFKLFHKNCKKKFPNLIERSRFNRRSKNLYYLTEQLRSFLVESLLEGEYCFLIDPMPISIVCLARANLSRISKEDIHTASGKGYCVSQDQFYDYKLHAVTSVNGVITRFDLSPTNVHDTEHLKQVRTNYPVYTILGDMAYLSDLLQLEHFERNSITPMRRNQKNYRKQPAIFRYLEKSIKTVFFQFHDQFNIQKNYSKKFWRMATHILSKLTAFTLLQYMNKYEFHNKLNHVKQALL